MQKVLRHRIDPSILTTVWRLALKFILAVTACCLPNDWRQTFDLDEPTWRLGTGINALCEAIAALLLLAAWYSYSVTHWAKSAIFSTIGAHPQANIPSGTEGFAALVLLFLHPLTWIIGYFALEGTIRFLAATMTGTVFGSLPFYALARLLHSLRPAPPSLPDELSWTIDEDDEILEIRCTNYKPGWEPPRIIRFERVL